MEEKNTPNYAMHNHPEFGLLPTREWQHDEWLDLGDIVGQCGWCYTPIRYVHFIKHPKEPLRLGVGCECVQKLCSEADYITAKRVNKNYVNKARRFRTWMNSPRWYWTDNGNLYRKDKQALVFNYKQSGRYKTKLGKDGWGTKAYINVYEAKKALFYELYGDD